MKSILWFVLLFLFFVFQTAAHAHIPGQPPFFRINGELTNFYPIEVDNPSEEFLLPQDISPRPFIVNEPIQFEIDVSLLPFPQDVIDETTFHWNFGIGETAEGYIFTHAYDTPGTHTVTVTADYGQYAAEANAPTEIQRMFIHVIPSAEYELPTATFTANGKTVNPEDNFIEVNLSEEVTLNASDAQSVNGKITSYTWYFDNGNTKTGKTVTTSFDENPYLVNPVLRITDSNGYITDTQITLKNTHFGKEQSDNPALLVLGVILLIAGGITLFVFIRKRRMQT